MELANRLPRWFIIALMALLTESGADLFNRTYFNYPSLATRINTRPTMRFSIAYSGTEEEKLNSLVS